MLLKRIRNAVLGALVFAVAVALLCFAYGGGGLAVPGSVGFLAGAGALIGFLIGAIGIRVEDKESS